jgi:hypothetical protein
MSLKSAIVMYRVDGVSGLNVLTGINAKVFFSHFWSRQAINPVPWRESVIGLQTDCPEHLSVTRSAQCIKVAFHSNNFFKLFSVL